jgi:peptidoglycan/xylan/chitin deacetylase (PgdA/CDA1 family)
MLVNPLHGARINYKPTIFTVPILVYHHIGSHRGIYYVSNTRFDQELSYLIESDYHAISMANYADFLEKGTALPDKPVILTFDDGYADAYTTVYPLLKAYHLTGTFYIITGKVGQPGYLTWDQIKEMAANGMEIGAHTITHPYLTKLHLLSAFWQIWGSRLDLERHLGKPVTTFAYPYNDHNRVTNLLARLAGYSTACIVDFHTGDSERDYFTMPRYSVTSGESINVFRLVVNRPGFPAIPKRR